MIIGSLIQEVKDSLFPQRKDEAQNIDNPWRQAPTENVDLLTNDNYMEIPEVIRVSEISYKNVNKKERDFAMMTKYCHQIKEVSIFWFWELINNLLDA